MNRPSLDTIKANMERAAALVNAAQHEFDLWEKLYDARVDEFASDLARLAKAAQPPTPEQTTEPDEPDEGKIMHRAAMIAWMDEVAHTTIRTTANTGE